MKFNISFLFFFTLFSFKSVFPTAVCLGAECNNISNETILGANLVDPILGEIYTKEFLNSMGEAAVLQNINSAMMGGQIIQKNRLGIGYSMARTSLSPREIYFENTELRELPKEGAAASPSLSYGMNLGHFLEKKGEWQKWNLSFQFFPYYLSETNIPFLKIRNTNVGGRVFNGSLNLRYFPFLPGEGNKPSMWNGLSFGWGLYQTNQEILLNAYDRRPTEFRVDGDRRKWIGINELKYESNINSVSSDVRYSYNIFESFSIYGGLGLTYNTGFTKIRVERYAAISARDNRDDFLTNPSGVGLDLKRKIEMNQFNGYGIFGFQIHFQNSGVNFEYLRNQNSESANLGIFQNF